MRNKVLIVDDSELNREILEEILSDEYAVLLAEDGKIALKLLEEKHEEIEIVLLDLVMPEVSGFDVLQAMKEKGWIGKIPVLVISGEGSNQIEKRCFDMGVSDFIKKPFDSTIVKKRVNNINDLFQYQNKLEEKVKRQTEMLWEQNTLLRVQAEKLHNSNKGIIEILGTVVEFRNLESGEHVRRVKGFTEILAQEAMVEYPEYGLTEESIDLIVTSSSLHDVGKITIPDNILLKPGRLTKEEFEIMKSHTTKGSDMLDHFIGIFEEDYRKTSYEICRHHHERYDGRGYPDGLVGEEIPIAAQLVAVADVYDALVSERVYKSAFSRNDAFHMILNGECGVFSPKLLNCFANVREKYEALLDKLGNL